MTKRQHDPSAPPEHLSAEAKDWWRILVREWVLEADALLILKVVMESYDRLQEARNAINQDGLVVVDGKGNRRPHPALTVEKESRLGVLRGLRQLGLDNEVALPSRK